MNKKVFILSAPLSDRGSDFYNGINIDDESYKYFFKSATAGAFFQRDIIPMENYSWEKMCETFNNNPCDYAVIVYTGHGFTDKNSKLAHFNINEREVKSIKEISGKVRAKKQLLIIDSCRTIIEKERFYNAMGDPFLYDFPSNLTIAEARILHNDFILAAQEGIQVIYSCDKGEQSSMDYEGSYFTRSLLNSVGSWATEMKRGSILLGVGAYRISNTYLKMTYGKRVHGLQNPKIFFTNPGANFPFAVRKGSELAVWGNMF